MDDQIIKIEHELNLSCVQICQFSRSLCEPHANRGLLTCSSKIFVNSRKFVFLNLAVISYPLSNLRILESSYICMDVSLAYYMKCSFCTWAVNNIPKQRRSNGISNGGVGLRNFGPFFFQILYLLSTVAPAQCILVAVILKIQGISQEGIAIK